MIDQKEIEKNFSSLYDNEIYINYMSYIYFVVAGICAITIIGLSIAWFFLLLGLKLRKAYGLIEDYKIKMQDFKILHKTESNNIGTDMVLANTDEHELIKEALANISFYFKAQGVFLAVIIGIVAIIGFLVILL